MDEETLKKIFCECGDYVNALKGCPKGYFLYRGFHGQIVDFRLFTHDLENRKPVNTPQELHDKLNDEFKSRFGWKIRNGVFCYGYTSLEELPRDLGYGQQYLCFPVGAFGFIYSPEHFDLCGYFYRKKFEADDKDIQNLIFKDNSLKEAIECDSRGEGLSNEISVNVLTYYLIDTKHRDDLAKAIWD